MPYINDRLEGQALESRSRETDSNPETVPQKTSMRMGQSRFLFDYRAVMAQLRARILGQPQVLDSLERTLKLVQADIGDQHRPLSVTLLMGATGVGKTETVRVLAEALNGSPDTYCRIDMNTLAQDHYAAAITGAPPGYVGSKEGHSLIDVEQVQGSFSRPGIVLFDEVEKAGPEVLRALLNVMDRGQLRLTSGNKSIDFCNALVFMTSNLGARELAREQRRWERGWRRFVAAGSGFRRRGARRVVDCALERSFDPEFINRIDQVLLYNPIDSQWIEGLVELSLARLNRSLAAKGWHLVLAAEVVARLQGQVYDPAFGARSVRRGFRAQIETAVADYLLQPVDPRSWESQSPPSLRQLNARLIDSQIVISAE